MYKNIELEDQQNSFTLIPLQIREYSRGNIFVICVKSDSINTYV